MSNSFDNWAARVVPPITLLVAAAAFVGLVVLSIFGTSPARHVTQQIDDMEKRLDRIEKKLDRLVDEP